MLCAAQSLLEIVFLVQFSNPHLASLLLAGDLPFFIYRVSYLNALKFPPSQFQFFLFFCFLFLSFCLFRAAGAAYGGSQARGLIRVIAAGLHHSHSNAGSQLCLQHIPQLTATPDP